MNGDKIKDLIDIKLKEIKALIGINCDLSIIKLEE